MSLSDIFVDPALLPQDGYGFCQLTTLLIGYGYVLFVASNMISDGSELLLLVPSVAGIVGSCVLPVLGAVPDGMIVLFSGLGPDAQDQLDVGVGALAGSTIMLITIPWILCIYAGRVNIEDDKSPKYRYTKNGKMALGPVTGVPNSPSVRKGGILMIVTSVSYVLLQGPAFFYQHKGLSKADVAAGESTFAAVGLVLTLALFVFYLRYQWKLAVAGSDEVTACRYTEVVINSIESGKVSLRGALFYELEQYRHSLSHELKVATNDAGSKGYGSIDGVSEGCHIYEQLPEKYQQRFSNIIRMFWRKFAHRISCDEKKMSVEVLGKLFYEMGETVSKYRMQELFDKFDADGNGVVDLHEFTMGTCQYLWENRHETKECEHNAKEMQVLDKVTNSEEIKNPAPPQDEEEEEDEEDELPEELRDLSPEEQQRRLVKMACTTMGVGTLLVVVLSDPMTDVLSELGNRTGIPAFYVSFVVAPLASNASELITSYTYALKKTSKSISISLQALQGAACMNNTFCLAIFMALVYFQGLAWEYCAETLAILTCQIAVAIASWREVQTMTTGIMVVSMYPFCLGLVSWLQSKGYD